MCVRAASFQESEKSRAKKAWKGPEGVKQVESTDPANGQNEREESQAKASFHEWNASNQETNVRRQPRKGANSRMGSMRPWPQNLQVRGSWLEPVIFWNQSRNFNFRMVGK